MNTNPKTRFKAEDMEWNALKSLGISKEQLEADGSMERLLQGMDPHGIWVQRAVRPGQLWTQAENGI